MSTKQFLVNLVLWLLVSPEEWEAYCQLYVQGYEAQFQIETNRRYSLAENVLAQCKNAIKLANQLEIAIIKGIVFII